MKVILLINKFKKKLKNNKAFILIICLTIMYAIMWFIRNDKPVINSDGGLYYKYFEYAVIERNIKGNSYIKYPIGTTLLQFPFLLIALGVSVLLNRDLEGGLSSIFEMAVYSSAWFYCILGICMMYKYLIKRYAKIAVNSSLVAILYGTMLVVYTTYKASFSHVYGFFLCSLFIQYIDFYEERYDFVNGKKRLLYDLFLGVILGFVVLVRNTNIIIGFVYLLYNVTNKETFLIRIKKIFTSKILVQIIGCFFIYAIQVVWWFIQTGNLIIYSYGDESFIYWYKPQILRVLFSDAKGLFIYSPVLLYSVIGMFLDKKGSSLYFSKWIVLGLQTYIISSWWCWWLGDAYSERMYCDFLPFFLIYLTEFIDGLRSYIRESSIVYDKRKHIFKWLLGISILFIGMGFITLNLIWSDGCYRWQISSNLAYWSMLKQYLKIIVKRILYLFMNK